MTTLGSSAFIKGRFGINFAALGEEDAGRVIGRVVSDAVKVSYFIHHNISVPYL